MRGTWLVVGAVAVLATGCGDGSSSPRTEETPAIPVSSPTAVPPASGTVTTTFSLLVTDDGSGPHACQNGNWQDVSPPTCSAIAITGWEWDPTWDVEEQDGVRWGNFQLVGTFDGHTFAVDAASQPEPAPYEWDFEIPCPTPDGGWQVVAPSRSGADDLGAATAAAQDLDGYALAVVSTPDGRPGPRDPGSTVLTVLVAGDVSASEAALREVWGGMLCVSRVHHSYRELRRVQHALLDVPGMNEVGSGNTDNQVDLVVLNDDGSIQRWVDQAFGEGVVVVDSNLQPVG
ncbi:hypothetical protein L2K70_02760 [Nocardioides KLBMP 9356]|uniref:Uncharacterized protein n=1 Tax=Nocardioides potassii TaxID=2911371 RepID=A0ABS9H7U0_9ACTN|nr:hypothetical protein [Nocardioides potassii]MCF6376514.1 hypothetical protein [Nocardioides potassii]